MSLPPLATVAELSARLPVSVDLGDATRAAAVLEDASALVRDEAGATWVDSVGALTVVPDVVRMIVLEVAGRALNRSFVYGAEGEGAREVGGLYLKGDEKRRLNAAVAGGGTKPSLWTLPTTRGDADDVEYRPVSGGGDPLPWGYTGPTPWNR